MAYYAKLSREVTDKMSTAELMSEAERRARGTAVTLFESIGDKVVSMTEATVGIWGHSGRGAPRAVRIIEILAEYGYVEIAGRKQRKVRVTDKARAASAAANAG